MQHQKHVEIMSPLEVAGESFLGKAPRDVGVFVLESCGFVMDEGLEVDWWPKAVGGGVRGLYTVPPGLRGRRLEIWIAQRSAKHWLMLDLHDHSDDHARYVAEHWLDGQWPPDEPELASAMASFVS